MHTSTSVSYTHLDVYKRQGIFRGTQVVHMAPPAEMVYSHISNLLQWAESSKEHPLIKSCVFHYEFEYIHPFLDGNGRMGRMWNTLLLYQWKPIFAWIPVESIIRERQADYYDALGQADSRADAAPFVEFLPVSYTHLDVYKRQMYTFICSVVSIAHLQIKQKDMTLYQVFYDGFAR